jgi:predicted ATPase/DNA-binding SARP family transcriptional activator
MVILALSFLGPFEAFLDQRQITRFRTKTVQALLAYLVVEAESPPGREFLSELLWPGMPLASGRKNLRQTLYELRQLFPEISTIGGESTAPLFLADRQTIQLNHQCQIDLDIDAFKHHLEIGTDLSLQEGVPIYRGDFLEGFYLPDNNEFEAWLSDKRAFYRRKLLDSLDRLAQVSLENDRYTQAETYARQQLHHDDLRESAVNHLMTALALQGQRVEALSQYEQFIKRLQNELNISPGPELTELSRHIREDHLDEFRGTVPLEPVDGRTIDDLADQEPILGKADASKQPVPQNLPIPSTPFIGRHRELARLRDMLQEDSSPRLITLLGPGGSGKTRLAIQIAANLDEATAAHFCDGIWFISLAQLTDPEAIVSEIAAVLHFAFPGQDLPPRQQLLDYLCKKRILVILDSYEHLLVPGTVPLAADIVGAAPDVKVIITSRTRLNVQGEHLVPVAGLPLTGGEGSTGTITELASEAAQLFCQSARRVRPEFELNTENQAAVTRICELVEGMPLAIELAASWVELLLPNEIAAEIEQNLDFLEVEWQDVPERQRSLRAVFNGSWNYLAPREREVLKRLTLFQGSFSQEAALAVAGASLRLLLTLANRSWLIHDVQGRYHIHALLRHYASDKLHEDPTAWRLTLEAHTSYYTSLVTKLGEQMQGSRQQSAFDTTTIEFENIRVTWYRLLEEGKLSELVETLLPGLFLFCSARSRGQDLLALVRDAQKPLLGSEQGSVDSQTLAILRTAEVAFLPGRAVMVLLVTHFVGWVFGKDKVELIWQEFGSVNDVEVAPLWLIISATLYGWQVDRYLATERLRILTNAFQERKDRWSLAYTMQNLARLLTQMGTIADKNGRGAEKPSPKRKTTRFHGNPEWEEGRQLLTSAEAIFTDIGDQLEKANTLRLSGLVKISFDLEGAEQDLQAAMQIMKSQGDLASAANALWNLAEVSILQGNIDQGFSYFDDMIDIYERLGNRQLIASALSLKSIGLLRHSTVDAARGTRIRSLTLSREIKDDQLTAWSLWELGDIERLAGEYDAALGHYEEARLIFQRLDSQVGLAFYFRGLGDVYLATGDPTTSLDYYQRSLDIAQEHHDWSATFALGGLGRALLALGRYQAAGTEFGKALKLAYEINHIDLMMLIFAGVCRLLLATNEKERAVELGTFVYHHHITWVEIKNQVSDTINLASRQLSDEQISAAQERGRNASKEAIVAQYLAELSVNSDQWTVAGDQ